MRIREDINANYRAVFFNGKTLRFKLDLDKDFGVPETTELEDVAINSKCLANCSYCYVSAMKNGKNFDSIVRKANLTWGQLDLKDRPFQIAIGGAGEPTMHPDFPYYLKHVNQMGITPNYTTNGMHLSDEVLKATEDYAGGVALSYHPHIEKIFHEAVGKLKTIKTKLNFHVIVGEKGSIDTLKELYIKYKDDVEYFVVLPYQESGRAKYVDVKGEWLEVFKWIKTVESKKFAFGALFYDFLLEHDVKLDMSLYEPELFSGYRVLDENFEKLYKSSYDKTEKYNTHNSYAIEA